MLGQSGGRETKARVENNDEFTNGRGRVLLEIVSFQWFDKFVFSLFLFSPITSKLFLSGCDKDSSLQSR